MAKLDSPPPKNRPRPNFFILEPDTWLYRVYNPSVYCSDGLKFRNYGPMLRFDHHRFSFGNPSVDNKRAVWYGGLSFSACIVEVFGDLRLVEFGDRKVAYVQVVEPLKLLDLRGSAAMTAGTIAAVCKCPHELSQKWSKFFYEDDVFENIDGIVYYGAHNDEDCVCLYERSVCKVEIGSEERLDSLRIRSHILEIAFLNGMIVEGDLEALLPSPVISASEIEVAG